jgi:hypothetical protein
MLKPLFARSRNDQQQSLPNELTLFDVVWRWNYNYHGQPANLRAYCPTCDTQLVYTEDRFPDRVWFTCEHCNCRYYEENGDKDYALAKVYRQIDRNLRLREKEGGGS